MNLKNTILGILLAVALGTVIVGPTAEESAEPTADDLAAVDTLLDKLDAICGEAFTTTRHRLVTDAEGRVTGCEERAPKVAAK